MRIILDTGMLFRPDALSLARESPHIVVLPAIALAERCRQLTRDGHDASALLATLHHAGVEVEPFTSTEAQRLPPHTRDDATWRRHARDALIAAHVGARDELWTTNPRAFEALGIPRALLRAW